MASTKQRETFDRRMDTSAGHFVRWTISARDLHVMRAWDFVKNYRTFCKTSPTSWDFKLSFPEIGEDGAASLSVALSRKDSLDVSLEAAVWVDVSDSREDEIYPRKIFTKVDMTSGSDLRETVELEPNPNMGGAVKRKVVVLVTLIVSSCHSETESSSGDGH